MKVITIQQPYASLVVTGHKKIETRSWNTKHRGKLLIHAGMKKPTLAQRSLFLNKLSNSTNDNNLVNEIREQFSSHETKLQPPLGAIIGCVDLVDVQLMNEGVEDFMQNSNSDNEKEFAFGIWSAGRYAWHLENPIMFKEPIPCKGQLGLWNYNIDIQDMNIPIEVRRNESINKYRQQVFPRDANGNHIEMSDKERMQRINDFRCGR